MKILILHQSPLDRVRKTMADHLYSFQRYGTSHQFHYVNIFIGFPSFLHLVNYDAIILHYSLLGMRCSPLHWKKLMRTLASLKRFTGIKIAMPQDEMYYSEELCTLFHTIGIDTVYTCAYPIDYQTLYPQEKSGLRHYITTLTGFIDEETFDTIQTLQKESPTRTLDIGYRGNNLPYNIGRHGQLKSILAHKFQAALHNSSLQTDISIDPNKVFYGDDWLRFLLRCRTMLGCLGGSGLHDPTGDIKQKTIAYLKQHPHATFDEVEQHCFPGQDNTLHLYALSPRHFECAMTKTCQLLIEGDYHLFKPGVDYIEIKQDFSNIDEVLEKVNDVDYCVQIAENAYQTAITSEKYTYRTFVNEVLTHITQHATPQNSAAFPLVTLLLTLRHHCEPLLDLWMKGWINWNILIPGNTLNKMHYILTTILPKQFNKRILRKESPCQ